MFNSKAKGGNSVPSDAQAREKLALYVYEYLLHVGAQKTAESFLREIRWEKSISLGEAPGFLHSWWCVFWDLYCAAPERREHNEHSSEAKAFHDYGFVAGQQNNGASAPPPPPAAPQYINGIQHNSNAPSPLGQMPPTDGMPGGPMPPAGFFPNSHMRPSPPQQPVNQPSPLSQPMMPNQAFISPRFPGGPGPGPRPGVRMPQQVDFNQPPGGVPGQPMMPNMDPNRQGTFITSDGTEFVNWQGPPPGMQQMNPRMAGPHPPPPRVPPMGQLVGNMGQFPPSMRPPNGPNGPPVNGQNGQQNGQQLPPLNMPGPGGPPGRPWQPNNNQMTYNSSSPGNHYGPPGSNSGPGPAPGTPIMPSPQGSAGPYSPASHRMGTPNTGRGTPGDSIYPLMKSGPCGNLPNQFVIGETGLQAPPASSPLPTDPLLETIKQSPGSHVSNDQNQDHNSLDYNNMIPYPENDQNESAAILKIKESMQEEAKRFEKDTPGDHPEFFMQ